MGFGADNGGGRGGRRPRRTVKAMSDVNVTPLVDVMLVLLIIFMITAPLLAVGVPVDLPRTKAPPLTTSVEPLTVTIKSDGKIFLENSEVSYDEFMPRLKAIGEAKGYDERVYVRGDRKVDYGTVLKVMGAIKAAGFTKIAMVGDPERR
jgi:biopolymer transport protein TolR